jgi:hypothetical protein
LVEAQAELRKACESLAFPLLSLPLTTILASSLRLTVASIDESERSNRGAVNNDKFKEMEQQVSFPLFPLASLLSADSEEQHAQASGDSSHGE